MEKKENPYLTLSKDECEALVRMLFRYGDIILHHETPLAKMWEEKDYASALKTLLFPEMSK